jgi:hypothetical protein
MAMTTALSPAKIRSMMTILKRRERKCQSKTAAPKTDGSTVHTSLTLASSEKNKAAEKEPLPPYFVTD